MTWQNDVTSNSDIMTWQHDVISNYDIMTCQNDATSNSDIFLLQERCHFPLLQSPHVCWVWRRRHFSMRWRSSTSPADWRRTWRRWSALCPLTSWSDTPSTASAREVKVEVKAVFPQWNLCQYVPPQFLTVESCLKFDSFHTLTPSHRKTSIVFVRKCWLNISPKAAIKRDIPNIPNGNWNPPPKL